jgi:electron transport complex protein RnfC
MGAEKVLIYNLLKRKVPVGSLPFEVGVVVNNVGTSKAVFDAVIKNRPLIERVITVTGDIERPVNLMVRIGTLLGDIVESVHVPGDKSLKLIFGGPMTGFSINNMDFPVTKAVNCILVKHVKKPVENNCIRCSRCIGACPMNLMPLMYASYVKNNRYDACREYYIESCIECGSCAFVCPASIPLLGYIKTGKSVLARKD